MEGSWTRNIQIIISSNKRTNEINPKFQYFNKVFLERNRTDILFGGSAIGKQSFSVKCRSVINR